MRRTTYFQRRGWRQAERFWSYVEAGINRLTSTRFNPLYHLGTLALFLLGVLLVTGIYLTIFYRPGADRAYETVAGISASPLGLLMRSVHRYAANALVVVVVLHALKMLLSDRFWESRWVAWVTGWALLGLIWFIGVMGYWLVWDRRAQWLTEYGAKLVGGSVALTFLGPDLASRSFAFFVIVLFLHVFLGILIFLGFLLHILRLTRPRWLAPRWLMVEASLALLLLALLQPATSLEKADFSRVVDNIPVDWLYLGFLPLSSRWGNTLFWGVALALFLIAVALPWLLPGRSAGPVQITEHLCTGCALCALKCPYEAIEIVPRSDESGFKSLAVIRPNLCVGCGLCIGTCAAIGIDLQTMPTSAFLDRWHDALAQVNGEDQRPLVIITCQRHTALGTFPTSTIPQETPHVGVERFTVDGISLPVVTVTFPCVGMLNPEWLRPLFREPASIEGALVVSCPTDDCAFREGPYWLVQNLKYRRKLLEAPLYWIEGAPGDRGLVVKWLRDFVRGEMAPTTRAQAWIQARLQEVPTWWPRQLRPFLAGLAVLVLVTGLGWIAERPATTASPPALVRVLMVHPGKLKTVQGTLSGEMAAKLPPGLTEAQVLGGERYPVQLRVEIDGQVIWEGTYAPSGLRREGLAYALENLPVTPGNHRVRIQMMDDGETWRTVFNGEVTIAAGRVVTLLYDEEQEAFVVFSPQP